VNRENGPLSTESKWLFWTEAGIWMGNHIIRNWMTKHYATWAFLWLTSAEWPERGRKVGYEAPFRISWNTE
jgi:hypothetical protein